MSELGTAVLRVVIVAAEEQGEVCWVLSLCSGEGAGSYAAWRRRWEQPQARKSRASMAREGSKPPPGQEGPRLPGAPESGPALRGREARSLLSGAASTGSPSLLRGGHPAGRLGGPASGHRAGSVQCVRRSCGGAGVSV